VRLYKHQTLSNKINARLKVFPAKTAQNQKLAGKKGSYIII